jgi:hypothetical protein
LPIRAATSCGTPCPVSASVSVRGSTLARPTIISEKNTPIDSDVPELKIVPRMPEAAPRSYAGTEFITAVVFGALNRPDPMPLRKMTSANAQ